MTLPEISTNVSSEEITRAKNIWNDETYSCADYYEIKMSKYPVLPKRGEKNILITSSAPYVNNVPHLGNIVGSILSADIFAKYNRMKGVNTLFQSGTDEYGTTTQIRALSEGLSCEELCAKYWSEHKRIYDWFNIEFDYFGRTTSPMNNEITREVFSKIDKNGYILEDKLQELYCENCSKYLVDRFVEGNCPSCDFNGACGDQCDKCGKILDPVELKSPRCKLCSSVPSIKQSKHLYLDIPKLMPLIEPWLSKAMEQGHWTNTALTITRACISEGVKPLCITRDIEWGISVPKQDYERKVFYVCFESEIGQIAWTANYTAEWKKWWHGSRDNDVELCQFMGKDNVPFLSIVFPCACFGTGDGYTLIRHLPGIEYLNYEGGKFSKSRGVGVFGNQAKLTNIESDVFRFYLTYIRPENESTNFYWHDLMERNNVDLVDNLANFIHTTLTLCKKNLNGVIPKIQLEDNDAKILAKVNHELKEYDENLEKIKLRDGIRNILNISQLGNYYIQTRNPRELTNGIEEEKLQCETVIGVCVNIVFLLSTLVYPYMPNISARIRGQLNLPTFAPNAEKTSASAYDSTHANIKPQTHSYPTFYNKFYRFLTPGHRLGNVEPLFKIISEADVKLWREKFGGGVAQN